MSVYTYRNPSEVARFLRAHPQVTATLAAAVPHLHEHFGADVRVKLEVTRERETGDRRKLLARILTPLPVSEAVIRLDDFDDAWFLDQIRRVDGFLNFDISFEEVE